MDKAEDLPVQYDIFLSLVERSEETDSDWIKVPYIESAHVQDLAKGSCDGKLRQGELIVTDSSGERHTFQIEANHQYEILDGSYTLVGSTLHNPGHHVTEFRKQYWVVGRRLERKFEKVSVFYISDHDVAKRLCRLDITAEKKTFLA